MINVFYSVHETSVFFYPPFISAVKVKWRRSSLSPPLTQVDLHTLTQAHKNTLRWWEEDLHTQTASNHLPVCLHSCLSAHVSVRLCKASKHQDSIKIQAFIISSGPNNGGKWHWGFHGNCCMLLRGLLWKHMSDLTGLFSVSLATDSQCSLSHCLALLQHLTRRSRQEEEEGAPKRRNDAPFRRRWNAAPCRRR